MDNTKKNGYSVNSFNSLSLKFDKNFWLVGTVQEDIMYHLIHCIVIHVIHDIM